MINNEQLPVLILAHSRAEKFNNCLKRIYDFGIRNIYLSIDGPRNNRDLYQQKIIIQNFNKFQKKCDLKLNKLEKNYGCRDGIIFALDWFFKNEKYGVILEEDLFLSNNCLLSFAKLLCEYKNDKNVMSLSSYNEFVTRNDRGIFFSPVYRGWGWATWRDKWQLHKSFITKTRKLSMYKLLKYLPDNMRNARNVHLIKAVHLNYLKAYDYEFNFSHLAMRCNSLTMSGINMNNLGFDEFATHCFDKEQFPFFSEYKDLEIDTSLVHEIYDSELENTLNRTGFYFNKKNNFYFHSYQKVLIFWHSIVFLLRRIKRIFIKEPGFKFLKKYFN